ncbi:CopD family protein [Spartinivicinus marinus]|uniref:CopD family protein n=1 Tax=Spartinivicinus marinus TaxID=2994442 RepID=UPI002252CD02|nr:CopD family protein [Spartinivicinus marinus]
MLAVVVLPKVLKNRSPEQLLDFESVYEKIGMPALIIQVATGIWLAFNLVPGFSLWFDLSNPVSKVILAKLILLGLTVGFALDARFRVIPSLNSDSLVDMAWHIIPVTIFSILFIVVGVSFKTGWLY